ncbi:ras-related protein Rab-32B-like [Glandiceps talaboti]
MGYFSPNYKLTIGVDFALKSINWNENTKVNLQLWDIAGHERFGHMTRVYYKYAIAAIIVFDLSRPATFDSVLKWYNDVNQKVMLANGQPVPVLLLANKCDLEDVMVDDQSLDAFCRENKFVGWFATSAKEDKNINEAMVFLVQNVLHLTTEGTRQEECIMLPSNAYPDEQDPEDSERKSSCCLNS